MWVNVSQTKVTCITSLSLQLRNSRLVKKDIEKIENKKMGKLLTIEGIHHLKADIYRLKIKIQNGGCGLIELEHK